jgi:hypothetical protein
LAAVAVVEDGPLDPLLAAEPSDVTGAEAVALDPAEAAGAVAVAAGLGWFDALSEGFWVSRPKLRITAATTIAATANPIQ